MSQFCARSRRGLRLERADSMAMFIAAGPLGAAAVVAMVACLFGLAKKKESQVIEMQRSSMQANSSHLNVYVRTDAPSYSHRRKEFAAGILTIPQ